MESKRAKIRAEIGTLVRRWRERQGLTIEELGKRAGIGARYLQVIEQGERDPSFSTVCAIAEGFGMSLGEMFSREHETLSDSAQELVKLYAEAPEPVRQALPTFLNACIAAKAAKARRREHKQMRAR